MPEETARKQKGIVLTDTRKVSGATNLPIQKSRTGEYDYEMIANIIKAAKDEGVDPNTALAIGLQESGLGSQGENVGQVNWGTLKQNTERYNEYQKAVGSSKEDVYKDARSLAFMLRKSAEDADKAGYTADKFDEGQRLQAYNGYGKIGANNDIGAKQLYGIDLTKNTIDMAKTPLYGKTIVDVRDNIIKANAEIQELINAHNLPDDEISGVEAIPLPSVEGKVHYQFKKGGKVIGDIQAEDFKFKSNAAKSSYLRTLYSKAKQNG